MPPRQYEFRPVEDRKKSEIFLDLCKGNYNAVTSSRQLLEIELSTNGKTDKFYSLHGQIFISCERFLTMKDMYVAQCAIENISIDANIPYCERIVGFVLREMRIFTAHQNVTTMAQCTEFCIKIYEENNADPEVIQAYINFINGN